MTKYDRGYKQINEQKKTEQPGVVATVLSSLLLLGSLYAITLFVFVM